MFSIINWLEQELICTTSRQESGLGITVHYARMLEYTEQETTLRDVNLLLCLVPLNFDSEDELGFPIGATHVLDMIYITQFLICSCRLYKAG